MTLNGDIKCHVNGAETTKSLKELTSEELDLRITTLENQSEVVPATITFDGNNQGIEYYVSKIEYG